MTAPGYAAVLVMNPLIGKWELMSDAGRVIVFDTPDTARGWMPLLGQGRPAHWSPQADEVVFFEIRLDIPNRARLVAPYDPGETAPWRRHIIWSDWWSADPPDL